MLVIFCPTSSVSVCASNKRGSVLVGVLKRFKQKSHSPKPVKNAFFQPTSILIGLSLFIAFC